MVKKLFKYELSYYIRRLPLYFIIVGFTAVMARFVQIFESDVMAYNILLGSSVSIFCIAVLVCAIMTVFSAVTRFYKNLFSPEGYLTLTLPVTTGQHLFVKLTCAMLSILLTAIVALVGVYVITAGDFLVEVLKAVKYQLTLLTREFGVNIWIYFIGEACYNIVAVFKFVLLFYLCIALGQLFSKRRITMSIVLYLGYSFVVSIINTIGNIISIALLTASEGGLYSTRVSLLTLIAAAEAEMEITAADWAFMHVMSGLGVVFQIVLCVVFFIVTYFIVKKKVNLE